MRIHVLILCTHNSARSVLAEAMLRHWAGRMGRDVQAHSAGSAPSGRVNPLALQVLEQAGIATEGLHSKSWDRFNGPGAPPLTAVITVCDNAAGESCPLFHGAGGELPLRVHWAYADPSAVEGDEATRLRAFEQTRLAISRRMQLLLELPLERLSRNERQAGLQRIDREA